MSLRFQGLANFEVQTWISFYNSSAHRLVRLAA